MKNQLINNSSEQFSLAPANFEQLMQFADIVSNSGMVPRDYIGKPGNVVVAVQMGVEIGLKPMQSLQNISVINGRPSVWGDALLAIVKSSKACEFIIEEISEDGKVATCEVKRVGESKSQKRTFSMEDARIAGLLGKDNWKKYPKRMLQFRARAWALRDVFPDILQGMQVAEEMEDWAYTQGIQNNNIDLENIPGTLKNLNLSTLEKDGKLIIQGNTSGKNQILSGLGFKYSSKSKEWLIELPKEDDVIEVNDETENTQDNTKKDTSPTKEIAAVKVEEMKAPQVKVKAETKEVETPKAEVHANSIPKIENIDHLEMFLETLELSFEIEDAGEKKWLCINDGDIENNKDILKTLGFKNFTTRGIAMNVAKLYPTVEEIASPEAISTAIIQKSSSVQSGHQDELPFD
jgi:hypothetical protein